MNTAFFVFYGIGAVTLGIVVAQAVIMGVRFLWHNRTEYSILANSEEEAIDRARAYYPCATSWTVTPVEGNPRAWTIKVHCEIGEPEPKKDVMASQIDA